VPRALILSADIGAGHDLPAELLAAGLRARHADAVIADGLTEMGRLTHVLGRSGVETILRRAPAVFDAQYWLIQRFAPTRRLAAWLLERAGRGGLLRLIARERPDVIVSTYPGTTEVLGRLRSAGRVTVPCVAAVTDLAALRYWAHPGIDRHLIIHAESRAEVEAIAGRRADIRHVRGLSRPQFDHPPAREQARAALGLGAGPLVLISGGGWGVGDLQRAARAALAAGATPVCLSGTNTALRARLDREGIRTEGFTPRICEWLAAADVLVHSTAGLTVLEAELCGTWAISYGWGVGHIRINNAAYRRFGLAAVASSPRALEAELRRALASPRARPHDAASWPAAADAVLELVDASGSTTHSGGPGPPHVSP
jgi:UDP-N-acetylglucosamine:LPS N-acetylglucosamine transferase